MRPTNGLAGLSRVSTSSMVPAPPAAIATTRRFIERWMTLASTTRSLLVQVILTVSATMAALPAPPQGAAPGVARLVAQLLLDTDELVVLGEAVRTRQRAGLDLPAVGRDREVGDGGILGLARAVRHHGGVGRAMRHLDRLQGLGERADLVDLDQ